jgi:Tol biopolymer transport system component
MSTLSCEQARLLLSDLLAGVIEPTNSDALDAHLSECAACRDQARAYCRLHRALSELSAQEQVAALETGIQARLAGETLVRPSRRTRSRVRWLVAAAALLLAVAAGFWFTRPAAEPAIARLERVEGEVYVVSGQAREPAAVGRELHSGQGLQTVGEESSVMVVYTDATRLKIGPDSTVDELSDGPSAGNVGKRVSLVTGSLDANVARQPEGRPMVLTTPHAQVVGQGTRLCLVNSPEATRVDNLENLEKGSVRLTQRSDGKSVELTPGTFSIARAQPMPLGPQPLAAQYTQPRASLPASALRIWALAFAPDGRTLVTGGSHSQVRLWDPNRGAEQKPVALTDELRDEVRAFAFSRDGRLLAAGGDNRPLTKLWDWDERKELASLPGHRTWIEALAFSKDARTLVVAGAHGQESSQIHLWDVERRQVRGVLDGHANGVWCVTFSPDGQTLASAGRDGIIKLWDFERGTLRQQLTGHTSEVYALAFSPDGSQLASSSRDKTVKLWNVATGQELHCLLGHSREVRAVAFAPDGHTVASGGQDNTVRLWRVADGQELATFKLPGSAFAVAYSPDGRTLAAGGWYKTVQLWDLPDAPAR